MTDPKLAKSALDPGAALPPRPWWRRPWIWVAIGLVVLVGVIELINRIRIIGRQPWDVEVAYLGAQAPHHKSVAVVFVHGIFGTKNDTWFHEGKSFPALLASDPEFQNHADVFLFEYFTPEFGSAATISGLARQLSGSLEDNRVFEDHKGVVFLSHSMGGLVVRQYLLTKHDLNKVLMLYFYATPTNGSELTKTAQVISSNPQLRGMLPLEGNDLLQSIQDGWLQWDEAKTVRSYCAFETLQTYGVWVVTQSSAAALCNQPLDPMSANHIDIVKPADRTDPRYSRFATALRKSLPVVEAGTMDDFENPGAWRRVGPVWSHRGQAFLAYKTVPPGVFQFTVQLVKGGSLFRAGRIRWCLNYRDSSNYALFELSNQGFWVKDVSTGKSTDRDKAQLNLDKVKMFTVRVEVTPQRIVHTILIDGKWVPLNSWTDNDRHFTDGKFGFLVQGADEIAISDFKFTPQ